MRGFTLTIATKIMLTSVIFAVTVAFAIAYLSIVIGHDAEIISKQSESVDQQFQFVAEQNNLLAQQKTNIDELKLVNGAMKSFADMRFWLYDLSVSWLNESESNAEEAKEKLAGQLQQIGVKHPDVVKNINAEVDKLYEQMIEAVDAYVDNNRVLGNSFVTKVRESSGKVDQILIGLRQQVQQETNVIGEKVEQAGAAVTQSGESVREAANEVVSSNEQLQKVSIGILVGVVILCAIFSVTLRRAICAPIESLRGAVEHVESESDLTHRVNVSSKDELGLTGQAFNKMMAQFQSIVSKVSTACLDLNKAIEKTTTIMQETNTSVSQQQLATDQVATAINQMSITVQQVASNAAHAADAASNASDAAASGHDVVEQTIKVIESLSEKVDNAGEAINHVSKESASIGTVLDVIRGVSEQTNLLALNAAIEAARAGEAGRGFAVVADEVRTLAQRTQESTQEIRTTIERLQDGIEKTVLVMQEGKDRATDGVAQAMKAGDSLEVITQAVEQINNLNSQIATAAEEQAAVTDEINKNITNIRDVSAQTSQNAQQTTDACNKQQTLSNQLAKLVNQFQV
ncbi:methyl-accepting chemotaxis protein [Spartinivicinus poritis]|uniref:Methyl-accepting chemotaxis protein n=1 Tax=Spartinivicinus poritis TaxID=2994640 RepID=A0ABT5U3A7_9GAMM|nr:methyl-accepting chemotaxis protein [Spartinivicinus sp. A2-2]MDE1460854.1 methyl-accepting chemotaxis protein [Spartinivicinus sp. A2-2]